jgi:hypothetical protein
MQCSAVQCSAVQCSAVQCSAVQCSAVQCSAVEGKVKVEVRVRMIVVVMWWWKNFRRNYQIKEMNVAEMGGHNSLYYHVSSPVSHL